MEFFGKNPISKSKYSLAKSAFFSICILVVFQFLGVSFRHIENKHLIFISGFGVIIGILIILLGMFNLGSSLRMGIPSKKTKFRSSGLYIVSRNPIYVGFLFVDIFGFLYTANVIVGIFALISIIFHHRIIVEEEKYLKKTFGKEYLDYKKRVRRYL